MYRATPSDGRPVDDMLGGAGSQQMPETEMNLPVLGPKSSCYINSTC